MGLNLDDSLILFGAIMASSPARCAMMSFFDDVEVNCWIFIVFYICSVHKSHMLLHVFLLLLGHFEKKIFD